MPVRSEYADADDYYRDYVAWAADQAVAARMREYDQQQVQRNAQERREQADREFQTRMLAAVSAGEQKYPDFTPVINTGLAPFLGLSPMLHEALIDLGSTSHDVAYHLAKDPGEALRLAQITNQRVLDRELTRLEVRITSSAPPPPAPPPVSNPPPVIPKTLTQQRDAKGQFAAPGSEYDGPTPLSEIFDRK
jgi:hypothetical protein